VRGVAERALVEARRKGLAVEELVTMIWEVAAEDAAKSSHSTTPARREDEEGVA
jgi:hypothetical protein